MRSDTVVKDLMGWLRGDEQTPKLRPLEKPRVHYEPSNKGSDLMKDGRSFQETCGRLTRKGVCQHLAKCDICWEAASTMPVVHLVSVGVTREGRVTLRFDCEDDQ